MTKRIKRFCILGLTAIGFLCAALLLFMPKFAAFADLQDNNGQFKFDSRTFIGSVKEGDCTNYDDYKLGFKIDKLKPGFTNVMSEIKQAMRHWECNSYRYTLELWKKTTGDDVKIKTMNLSFLQWFDGDAAHVEVIETDHIINTEKLVFASTLVNKLPVKEQKEGRTVRSGALDASYGNLPFVNKYIVGGETVETVNPCIFVILVPGSANVEYYVTFSYTFFHYTGKGFLSQPNERISGSCTSESMSLFKKFNQMKDEGTLSEKLTEAEQKYADTVLDTREKKKITVEYLQRIEGTPFAEKTQESAEVWFVNGETTEADIASALNIKSFTCLDSKLQKFEVNGSKYTAVYDVGRYLKAYTVDGNDDTIWLNINKSYKEFYTQFKDVGIMEQGAYEYVFSQKVYGPFKEKLEFYKPDEIYGYFALTLIPRSHTMQAMFADIFNVKTSKAGATYGIDYGVSLGMGDYQKLLDDFKYSYLKRVWNGFGELLTLGENNATAYILYVDPAAQTSFIDETGSGGEGTPPLQKIWDDTVGKVLDFIGDGWNTFTGFINGLSGTWKVVIAVVIIAAVVVLLVAYAKYSKKR